MRSSVLRAALATASVGVLVAGAVALGGPASAAGGASSSGSSGTVAIGCAIAVDGGEAVAPEAAVPVDVSALGEGKVLSASGEVFATALPDGSVEPPEGSEAVEGVEAVEAVEAFTVEISEEDLPDCPAAD